MRRCRRKVEPPCERMSRYPSHWRSSCVLVFLLCHTGKLANLSTGQPSTSTRMAVGAGSAPRATNFDDDENDSLQRAYTLKDDRMRQNQEPATIVSSNKSLLQVAWSENLDEMDRSSLHGEFQHNDDLLALESDDGSQLVSSTLPQYQALRSPPYASQEQFIKTNLSVFNEATAANGPFQHPAGNQNLKLHRTPEKVPIYLRHLLPSSVTRPQIVAFEHPASIRKQTELASHNQDGYSEDSRVNRNATFALLPSWPKIYIAQRERPSMIRGNETHNPDLDPKVPTIYPSWSSRKASNEIGQMNSVGLLAQQEQSFADEGVKEAKKEASDSAPAGWKTNFTTSEVEYAERERDQKSISKEEKSHETSELSKLLRQASKSDVTESLMLTNKSIVSLVCDNDSMLVRFKFKQPFHGLVETNLDPNEQCRLFGNGSRYYEMQVDLYGCGTRQEMPRLFINNLQIRYQDPFLLIHSRLQFLQEQQQQNLVNDKLSEVEEVKTIICSYPIRPALPSSRKPLDLSSNDLNQTNESVNGLFKQSPGKNLSDRIIEVPTQNSQELGPLFYYEPVLLISGLLLLAIACTLALVTSAYLMRRRHQKIASRASSTIGGSSQLPSFNGMSASPMRIYNRSPAQMANQRSLLAPPLIGLSKEELLRARPSMKQYPSNSSQVLRAKTRAQKSSATSEIAERAWMKPSKQQRTGQSSTTTDTGDSLESDARGDESSVTTIHIPYVQRPEVPSIRLAKTSNKRKLERDEAVQTDPNRGEERRYSEYKQIKRQERIIETSYQSKANETKMDKSERVSTDEKNGQSPNPFGSFRAKLTSPNEFKRLQSVKRLFEQSRDNHEPASSLSRLKMRICRTLSESERLRLIEMLSTDEVFKSNILDSIDRQSFSRKLRDNSNYARRFSHVTWNLLEEILLRIDIDKLMSEGERAKMEENLHSASGASQNYSSIAHNNASPPVTKSRGTYETRTSRQHNTYGPDESGRESMEAARVSHLNSSGSQIVPHGTLLVDSVTNITTPRNATAFSSSFRQTTTFEETHHPAHDSLPYMDEFSQGSINSQSLSSLDDMHRRHRKK